ncbi:mitochondrial fission 1 protein isoform X2 [Dermochelys coriacea]|uniref:mitochondrial fission 1 protein isoform X2 n=1 Tax=Dermochelys coriacea TaxID=27794 RepID=UPI0018E70D68|nr:mitochondrial fission 1 protein isoform X2 [Dermochelys coriacea]
MRLSGGTGTGTGTGTGGEQRRVSGSGPSSRFRSEAAAASGGWGRDGVGAERGGGGGGSAGRLFRSRIPSPENASSPALVWFPPGLWDLRCPTEVQLSWWFMAQNSVLGLALKIMSKALRWHR